MRAFRATSLSLILLLSLLSVSHAQIIEKEWQQLAVFPDLAYTVHFIDLPGPPRVGFVGCNHMVYRTSDGGETWNPTIVDDYDFQARDFVFKDSLTGWFVNWLSSNTTLYKTTDGGLNWHSQGNPVDEGTAIYYLASSKTLFLSGWGIRFGNGKLCYSKDDGASWTTLLKGDNFNAVVFLNLDTGIVTTEEGDYLDYLTTDGGMTWSSISRSAYETWQPLADTFRNVFWAGAEAGGSHPLDHQASVFQSTDFGKSFNSVATVPSITGTMREGSCGTLYLQASIYANDNAKGILRSTDGVNWALLTDGKGRSGPFNRADTRFYVKGTYVYALRDTAGRDSVRLWRYVEDTTKFGGGIAFTAPIASTKRVNIVSTSCADLDTTIYVIYQNDCIPAILESATLKSGDRFVIYPHDSLPHAIQDYYPLVIGHRPLDRSSDSTTLYLHYFANGKDIYDTVAITAIINAPGIITPINILANDAKSVNVRAGDTVRFTVHLTDSVDQLVNLDSIEFQSSYDNNVLSFANVRALAPWSIISESHGNGTERLAVSRAEGTPLLPNSIVAEIDYVADISTNSSTAYTLSDLRLNDAEFDGCAGTASLPIPPTVSVSACGDTLFRAMMSGEPMIQLLGVEVTGNSAEIKVKASRSEPVQVEVYDLLGERVGSEQYSLTSTSENLAMDISNLPSGIYFVRLATSATVVSSKFILGR